MTALVALAHAHPVQAARAGNGALERAPIVRPAGSGVQRAAALWTGSSRADRRAPARPGVRTGARTGAPSAAFSPGPGVAPYGGYGHYGTFSITPVSDPARPEPHPPADSRLRTGSIREDVARYSQERGAFRPLPRADSGMQRPPMPSPFRN